MTRYALAAFFLLLLCPLAVAQDLQRLPSVENLLKRVEHAEQRIDQLEVRGSALPVAASAEAPDWSSLAERLTALEEANKAAAERASEQAAQEAAAAASKSSSRPTLNIAGRLHVDYWNFADDSPGIGFFENPDPAAASYGADPEDRFFFRRIRLKFDGDIFDNMRYRMQIDFNTPDSGEMKDMYIGFDELPILGSLLIGNQKRPLGLDHLNSSRFNIFIERPLVIEAFNEDARRFGVAAYRETEDEVYNWRYGIYALENPSRDGKVIGDSMQLSGNARLASSPWYDETSGGRGYFHWAVAGMVARPDGDASPADANNNEARFRTRGELRSDSRWINTGRIAGADWYEILAFESILNLGPLQIVGEYQSNWMQRDDRTPGTGRDLNFHGAYVYVAYMLTGEHVPLNRRSGTIGRIKPFENFFLVDTPNDGVAAGWGAWQVALRYSYLDLSDEDILGGEENNTTLGLVWYMNAYSSMQFNAIYGDIRNREAVAGFTAGHFTALGTRLRIDF